MENKKSILIVDDESVNVEYVANILSELYELKVAYSGSQALKVLEKFDVDLVLLDIQMPGIDGYEVAKKMQKEKRTRDIPFIFLTSDVSNSSILHGFRQGAKDYITKPFNIEELKVRVANHLQTYSLQKQIIKQQKYLEMLLNSQPSMVILTDAHEVQYANKTFLDFFQCKDVAMFQDRYRCVCHTFIKHKNYFYMRHKNSGENWVKKIQMLPQDKRIVSMVSHVDTTPSAFNVSINGFEDSLFIINFNDISQTMLKQLDLKEKVIHDKLTHAYNREYFEQSIHALIAKHTKNDLYTAIAMLDIDYFKKVNDTYGHYIGDKVLKRFVKVLNSHSREHDVLIRWGGEEFIFVLPVRNIEKLHQALENFRLAVENEIFEEVRHITCSIGATLYNDKEKEKIKKTVQRSDMALYNAKTRGRNIVVIV
jgi:two-component system, cell cycle response regulator